MLSKVRKSSLRAENHEEYKKNLLADLKKNVKSLMELLAYRKLVNEDSGVVYQLCLSVEACIKHGLKRRALDSFTNADTYYVDLLSRLDQLGCASAAYISSRLRTLRSKSPVSKSPVAKMFTFGSRSTRSEGNDAKESLKSSFSLANGDPFTERVLWIRIALVDKHLLQVLGCLASNAAAIYQPHALFADPVCGPLIPALLAGPCSVDYSHLRGSDIPPYGDNSIEDVLNRRKPLSSSNQSQKSASRQNLLTRARHFSIAAGDLLHAPLVTEKSSSPAAGTEMDFLYTAVGMNWPGNRAPELIFAKNNVAMEPHPGSASVLGYLAICVPANNSPTAEEGGGAVVRWTPNNIFQSSSSEASPQPVKRIPRVVTIRLAEVSHIHCHTRPHSDSHATIVFIGRDGVQFPAMVFKQAGSALSLLQALSTAVPRGSKLEPPLAIAAVDAENESRDLVFQIVPTSPKQPFSESSPHSPAPSSDETKQKENSKESVVGEAEEAENKMPPLEAFEKLSEGVTRSKTDFDFQTTTCASLPTSKSIASGMSATLEAALSAVTMAGAQYFNEIEHMEEKQGPSHHTYPRGVNRLTFVCRSVQRQLLARAFYGWFAYVRHVKTVRNQLAALVLNPEAGDHVPKTFEPDENLAALTCATNVDEPTFSRLKLLYATRPEMATGFFHRLIYSGGVANSMMRPKVWSVLLGITDLGASDEDAKKTWDNNTANYTALCLEWQASEQQAETLAANRKLIASESFTPAASGSNTTGLPSSAAVSSAVPQTATEDKESVFHDETKRRSKVVFTFSNIPLPKMNEDSEKKLAGVRRSFSATFEPAKLDAQNNKRRLSDSGPVASYESVLLAIENGCVPTPARPVSESVDTPAPSDPQMSLLAAWLTNLHRIDKDVARCDRSLEFFRPCNPENLASLRRVVCSYVWQHLEVGYIQGMCDLAAPFLVVCKESNEIEYEAMAFTLFSKLMDRLHVNFPTGVVSSQAGPAAIDIALSRLRSLIQILDPDLYEHLAESPSEMDATHLYFAYRWLLLDFKREFVYADVFRIWETIWAADDVASRSFSLFIAFALIETYRDVIVAENMDFTDIIKFFNDMAERHSIERVLDLARQLVKRVQETSLSSAPLSPAVPFPIRE